MTAGIDEQIVKYVASRGYVPQDMNAMAQSMGVESGEYAAFRDAVRSLMRSGRVVMGSGKTLTLPEPTGRVEGTYRGHPKGFGFVVPSTPTFSDLYIPGGESLNAITGDRVAAKMLRKRTRGDRTIYEGRIVEVLERGHSEFVGELVRQGERWFVVPDGKVLHVPIAVKDVGAKNAKHGDQVVVELLQYPGPTAPAKGVIIERLGKRGRPGIDLKSTIHQFHLPEEFGKDVLSEAGKVSRAFDVDEALAEREDLRDLLVVTIDPDDAKDYDDAISLEKTRTGWTLGVHIADASAFVCEGGALDKEARTRGNSVYLPGMVIPMLPAVLSNGLCSLQEGEDRLTKSAFIEYDKKGHVKRSRFVNGVIRSTKRLTYGDATKMLDGKGGRFSPKVKGLVKEMERLARVIKQRRLDEGMLTLDLPEVELVLDDRGRVTGTAPADTSFSHTIIEMFMVEANEATARLLNRFKVPYLRRIHPEPDGATGQKLTQFVKVLGHALPKKADRKDLQALLASVKGKPESFAVNLAVLRSMMPAEYSPSMVGHYALASKDYAHFTSPIRRYPDLAVHRLIEAHLTGRLSAKRGATDMPSEDQVRELGEHCSVTSRRAEEAERDLKQTKVLELLSKRVGDEFAGVVTGVANSGVFVQITEYMTDGMMRFEEMADDWWEVNERMGSVSGQRTGMRITIGDALRIRILRVNVPGRTLDLTLASTKGGGRTGGPRKSKGRPGKPKVATHRDGGRGPKKTHQRRGRR